MVYTVRTLTGMAVAAIMCAATTAASDAEGLPLDNPLSQEVVRRGGGTSEDDMEAYGKVAGASGGAAACAAFLTPATAPACGAVGGVIGGWTAKQLDGLMAKGSTMEDLVVDTMKKQRPYLRSARRNVLALGAYDVMRATAVQELGQQQAQKPGIDLDLGMQWADHKLSELGAPPLARVSELQPTWEIWENFVLSFGLLADGSCAPGGLCQPDPNSGWGKECKAAIKLGVAPTCYDYFVLMRYGGFPPAPPGAGIDWSRAAFLAGGENRANALLATLRTAREQASAVVHQPPPPPPPESESPPEFAAGPMFTIPADTFPYPRHKGVRLDLCLHWGTECGQPAADSWCKEQGYARASAWQPAQDVGASEATVVMGDGRLCQAPTCDSFSSITCAR